jgi:hypothetical protein
VDDLVIRFPVTCPLCGGDSLACRPFIEIIDAFFRFKPLVLFAPCHGAYWSASEIQLSQIRDYVSATLRGMISSPAELSRNGVDNHAFTVRRDLRLPQPTGAHR